MKRVGHLICLDANEGRISDDVDGFVQIFSGLISGELGERGTQLGQEIPENI